MDYLVATGTLPPAAVYAAFQAALARFVAAHLAAVQRRRHRAALDGALYRNKMQVGLSYVTQLPCPYLYLISILYCLARSLLDQT